MLIALSLVGGRVAACRRPPTRRPKGRHRKGRSRKSATRKARRGSRREESRREEKVDNRKIQRKLQARTDLKAENLPLKGVVKQIAELHEIAIRLDEVAAKKIGVSPDKPITVSIENFTLSLALKHILKDLNLHFGVVNGEIVIGDPPPPPEPEERPVQAPVAAAAEAVIFEAVPEMMQINGAGGEAQVQQFTRQHKALAES